MESRTYLASDLAGELGLPRSTINDWLTRYAEYLESENRGKRRFYSEKSLNILREIAELRNAGKSSFEIEQQLAARYGIRPEVAHPEEPETAVAEAPTSWQTLMDETYTMDMLMLNSPRDTLAIALVMAGHDLNSTDPDDLADAKAILIEQKPMVLAYVVDEVKDKMIGGEASVALVWSGDATYCMDENDALDYVVPEEGSNIFFDSICIPANARNVEGAEKFIDFLCRADIAAMNYEYVGYAIPNTAAIELLGAEEYNASPVNNPPQEVLDKCQVFKYLGDDTKLYDQIWTEIISEF